MHPLLQTLHSGRQSAPVSWYMPVRRQQQRVQARALTGQLWATARGRSAAAGRRASAAHPRRMFMPARSTSSTSSSWLATMGALRTRGGQRQGWLVSEVKGVETTGWLGTQ